MVQFTSCAVQRQQEANEKSAMSIKRGDKPTYVPDILHAMLA